MKNNFAGTPLLFSLLAIAAVYSCKKDDSKIAYGYSKIYMPQAIINSGGVDNNYPVPMGSDSSTYNYYLDSAGGKLNVILGASLSGPGNSAYSATISVNNDTVQQMFNNKVFDTTVYELMPAATYSLPTRIDVPQGAKSGTFNLSIDVAALKSAAYAGKYLVLAVRLSNPTQYILDTSISTTIVVLNVNSLVIGPAVNVTSKYILNAGGPFIASSMNGSRWGSLQSWTANASALSHGGVGGFCSDGDGQTMDMESGWGSAQILNGKIYQTLTLPAGTYSYDGSGGGWIWEGTKDPGYVVVAPSMDSLPDYGNITGNTSILYQVMAQPQPGVAFHLTASTQVTVGVVVNYIQDQQGFKAPKVTLYNYPKHL